MRIGCQLVIVGVVLSSVAPRVMAVTHTVTNINDSGPGSLRQAVLDAYANYTTNTITFQNGLTGDIVLSTGEIAITRRLTITGPGADVLAVSGNQQSRVFNVSATVTISGLTIKDGKITNANGGGIYNNGVLTLNDLKVTGNSVHSTCCDPPSNGSGIYNNATLYINGNTAFTNNSASEEGGGIYNAGFLTINGNLNLAGNAARRGGGVYNDSAGTIMVTGASTLADNTASEDGGGIYNRGINVTINNTTILGNMANGRSGGGIYNAGTLAIRNSTLSNNIARNSGGAIINVANANLTVSGCTIAENAATAGDGSGGGIHNAGVVTFGNSMVIANNAATNPNIVSNGSGFTNQGSNLFGQNGVAGITGFTLTASDQILAGIIDTAVMPIDDYGGPSLTHNLLVGSPAVDAGDNSLIPEGITTDQRGAGFPRINGSRVDIGAVEYTSSGPTYVLTISKTGTGTGTITSTPAGINCGVTCSANFANAAVVTLNITPTTGSSFGGWTGDADCTDGSVTMAASKTCTATFNTGSNIICGDVNNDGKATVADAQMIARHNIGLPIGSSCLAP